MIFSKDLHRASSDRGGHGKLYCCYRREGIQVTTIIILIIIIIIIIDIIIIIINAIIIITIIIMCKVDIPRRQNCLDITILNFGSLG